MWCSSDSAVYHVDVSCNPPRVETFADLDGLRFGKYAITGLSPLEYLRDRRVAQGRELLAQATGKHVRPTLSEIAYQVGMSPRQFSKYLRQ